MNITHLKRELQPMPEEIAERLNCEKLMDAYHQRPPYQQNDYLGWIARAKLPETRQKRIEQMVDELRGGKLYMNMKYNART